MIHLTFEAINDLKEKTERLRELKVIRDEITFDEEVFPPTSKLTIDIPHIAKAKILIERKALVAAIDAEIDATNELLRSHGIVIVEWTPSMKGRGEGRITAKAR